MAGTADVDRAVAAARAALEGPWGKTPPTSGRASCTRSPMRSSPPHGARRARNAERWEGCEPTEPEVIVAAESCRYMASAVGSSKAEELIRGRSSPTRSRSRSASRQIVPWNYPIMLAAGNRTGPGRGPHDRSRARPGDPADRPAPRRACRRGRDSRRASSTSFPATAQRPAPRSSLIRAWQGHPSRLDGDRVGDHAPRRRPR